MELNHINGHSVTAPLWAEVQCILERRGEERRGEEGGTAVMDCPTHALLL